MSNHPPNGPSMGKTESLAWIVLAYIAAFAIGLNVASGLQGVTSAWWAGVWADVAATAMIFAFSMMFANSSFYDAYWSVLPPVLVAFWVLSPEATDSNVMRQWLTLGVTTAWGVRLTANWAIGWTGMEHEDWRYVMLREKSPRLWPLVSFGGVHLYPTIQVLLTLLPAYIATTGAAALGIWGLVGAGVSVVGIALESLADQQLRVFRQREERGAIINEGLWAWCRHPNYLGEQLFWWGLWFLALDADLGAAWTVIGPASLSCMFVFATIPMMDKRLLASRPAYAEHMKRVPSLIPRPPR